MNTYLVQKDWEGYSRGYTIYKVEAESPEEAAANYWSGEKVEHEVIRNDTEGEVYEDPILIIEKDKQHE